MAPTLAVSLLLCFTLASLPDLSLVNAQGGPAGVPCGSTTCLNNGTCINNACDCTGTMYMGSQCETLTGT